jgi:hypothetical protein
MQLHILSPGIREFLPIINTVCRGELLKRWHDLLHHVGCCVFQLLNACIDSVSCDVGHLYYNKWEKLEFGL